MSVASGQHLAPLALLPSTLHACPPCIRAPWWSCSAAARLPHSLNLPHSCGLHAAPPPHLLAADLSPAQAHIRPPVMSLTLYDPSQAQGFYVAARPCCRM